MQNETEIQELKQELETLTSFISANGTDEERNIINYACNTTDALLWILEEITTEHFKSDAYLDLFKIRAIAENIEYRTGENMQNYT